MKEPPTPEQLDAWVIAYLDGTIDADAFDQLSQALRTDPAALDRFVELASLDRSLLDTLTHGEQVQTMQRANLQQADGALSFEARLALLNRGSESAQLVHLHGELKPHQRWMPYLVSGAIAAVLVLAVTLTFVFSSGPTPSQGPALTHDPNMPAESAQPIPRGSAVATLTDTAAAKWSQGAFASGDALASGQRLSLTQGSATLTTAKGAVATLYAPCSIELINDNALRLTRGRLSGRVDTQQAEGFAVHLTSGDKIVDLGTAFTVAVADTGEADVRVTEGLVAWVPQSDDDTADPKPTLIAAGEMAQLVAGRPVLTRADRLLGIDFQHTGEKGVHPSRPKAGVTQPGFVAFDQTRVAEGNRAAFATDAGEITLTLAGLDQDQHNGYFTRLPTPAEDPFPGFDLYNDFVFENDDGRFTLTLAGPGIAAGQAYDLTFYAYDPGRAEHPDSSYGQTQSVVFAGIDGTTGRAGPITYTVGTHPTRVEQYKTTAAFTADAQGRITIEATDAFEDNEQNIRLGAIEIARRLAPDNDTNN